MEETMKCVQEVRSKEIKKVRNEEADKLVRAGTFKFVPKKLWKEIVRGPVANVSLKPKKINKSAEGVQDVIDEVKKAERNDANSENE